MDNILVRLRIDGDYVALTTYCRRHGRRGRFLLILKDLKEWLLEDHGEWNLMDEDCGNIISLYVTGCVVHVHVWWLSSYGQNDVQGFSQRFCMPVETLRAFLCNGEPIRYLYRPKPQNVYLITDCASRVIRHVCSNKLTRRALSKAMRDCFKWKKDTVIMYSFGQQSFYFTTISGHPSCGGLILHETVVHTPVGEKRKLYYSVYT